MEFNDHLVHFLLPIMMDESFALLLDELEYLVVLCELERRPQPETHLHNDGRMFRINESFTLYMFYLYLFQI